MVESRKKTLSGEMVTIESEVKGSDTNNRHWFIISGTAQAVVDYLNENKIPDHKVKGTTVLSTTWHVLFHK